MIAVLSRYKYFLIFALLNAAFVWLYPKLGAVSIDIALFNLEIIILVLPPIFVLLGLLDVWVPKEIMIRWLGEKSGLMGISIAFLLGSAAAGPLYAAFPVACILLKKEARLLNILVFIGAWSTTKLPMLLFEVSSLGWKFMVTRLIVNIFGVVLAAYIIDYLITASDKSGVYSNAKKMG